jgi:hypothetical protein
MQDISRVTGDGVIVESNVKGRTFVLSGMTFEDLGAVQKRFLRDKRERLLEAAKIRADLEDTPEARQEVMDKAQAAATQIAYLSDEEFNSIVKSPFGATELLWVLFQRQFPNQVTRTEIIRMANAGEFPADSMTQLISELLGGSPGGNSTGQSNDSK